MKNEHSGDVALSK